MVGNIIKEKLKNWLDFETGVHPQTVQVLEVLDHEANTFKNRIWYRGDPSELHQFYTSIDDMMGNTKFWQATATNGPEFRKIHTGLPGLIVDILTNVAMDDMNALQFDDTKAEETWGKLEKELPDEFFKNIINEVLYLGDGAIRFCYHPEESDYPIPEFYPADKVEFFYQHGKISQIIFKLDYLIDNREYVLHEIYSLYGIDYELFTSLGDKVNIEDFDIFANLQPVRKDIPYFMAVPIIFGKSAKYKGRGKSLFDGKEDSFDSFDEAYSQWIEAIRDHRTKTYIPDNFVPRNPKTGELGSPNTFDSRYVKIKGEAKETIANKIEVTDGDFEGKGLLSAYVTALDQCLQGLISPSTLGIDIKKLDNADAQREKEKVTLYTRNQIIKLAKKIIPKTIETALMIMDTLSNTPFREYNVVATFGEYANPSFEAVVETVGKAKQYGVMSNERVVAEMYGDDWDKKEMQEEIERLNKIDGIGVEEPSVTSFD